MRVRGDELWLLAVVTTAIFAIVAWSLGLVPEPPRPADAAPTGARVPSALVARDAG